MDILLNEIPLMPFEILTCFFLNSSLSPVIEVPPQYSGYCWRERVSPAMTYTTGVARPLLTVIIFPVGEVTASG